MTILKPFLSILLSLSILLYPPSVLNADVPFNEPQVVKRDVFVSSDFDFYDFSKDRETYLTEDDILEEIRLGEMELIAQVVQAEAGNQDFLGKRLVADVILNRVDSDLFPNSVEEVIFQNYQFSCVLDGNFDKAAWNMSEESYQAVEWEWCRDCRADSEILYFSVEHVNGRGGFQYGGHWFSY